MGRCILEIDDVLSKTSNRILKTIDPMSLRSKIINDDILNQFSELASADVIFIYSIPSTLKVLSPYIKEHCRPGTRICTYEFKLPDDEWSISACKKTYHHLLSDTSKYSYLYLYVI
jgi:hypothetical protein